MNPRAQELSAEFEAIADAFVHASVELQAALVTQGTPTVGVLKQSQRCLDLIQSLGLIALAHVR